MIFKCPNCGSEPNMIIEILTEQPSKFYRRLPNKISITPKKSLNSAMVNWNIDNISWICPDCRTSGNSLIKDCI